MPQPPLNQIVNKAFDLHMRYVAAVGQITADYVKQFIDTLKVAPATLGRDPAPAARASQAPAPAMVFEGAGGAAVSAVFLLQNHLPEPIRALVVSSRVVSPSGDNVDMPFTFVPQDVPLKSLEQVLIRVVSVIPDSLAENLPYAGFFSVPELKGTSISFIVRRQPAAERASKSGVS